MRARHSGGGRKGSSWQGVRVRGVSCPVSGSSQRTESSYRGFLAWKVVRSDLRFRQPSLCRAAWRRARPEAETPVRGIMQVTDSQASVNTHSGH